jgi:hypothetical protein
MSESATFSQPTTATTGLQNYDLERGAKELYPSPTPGRRQPRNRHAAWRKRFSTRGLKKESPAMTTTTIDQAVATLRKSVAQIVDSGADNRDDLLNKSFAEFGTYLTGTVTEQLAKAAPAVEEPLYKGLGCVGRVANLVGSLAEQIATIKRGYDRWSVDKDGNPPADADPASPDLVEHLEDVLLHAEMLMRVAVNENCTPMDDDEDPGEMMAIHVPVDGGGYMVVKTDLPEDLAKFATDPATIDRQLIELGFQQLALGGVDVEGLSKALQSGDLAKFAAAPGAGLDAGDAATVAGATPDDGQPQNPLQVLIRLLALALVQADYLDQIANGSDGPSDPTGEDPANAGGASESQVDTTEAAEKGVKMGALAKVNPATADVLAKLDGLTLTEEQLGKVLKANGLDLGALKKMAETHGTMVERLAAFDELVPKLLAQPEPPKAPLISRDLLKVDTDMLNSVDGRGGPSEEQLSKMTPEQRAKEVLKKVHATGGKPTRGVD